MWWLGTRHLFNELTGHDTSRREFYRACFFFDHPLYRVSKNEDFLEKLVLVLSEAVLVLVIDYDYAHKHELKYILKM